MAWIITTAVLFFMVGALARGSSNTHGAGCECPQCLRNAYGDPVVDNEEEVADHRLDVKA